MDQELVLAFEKLGELLGVRLKDPEGDGKKLIILDRDTSCGVQIKTTRARASIEEMKGALAMMLLEVQDLENNQAILGLVIGRLSPNLISELREYARSYARELGLFLMEEEGEGVYLDVPFLDLSIQKLTKKTVSGARPSVYNQRAFTDLNRWLLKVLMLHDAPAGMWPEGTFREKIGSPAELARCAGVSTAKAYQFAQTFKKLKWLRWTREEFEITDRIGLFEQWYQEERQILFERIPARPLFPRSIGEVYKSMDGVSYAIGGLAGCGFHGVRHIVSGLPEVHIFDPVANVVESAELEVCEEHEAELFLRRGPNRESIERGAVVVNGVRVVDILQAALDVSQLAVRGEEQAEHIIHGVLGWKK